MTILGSQRSDSGTYELTVIPDDFQATTIKHEVKISVKCKCNVFPYFLLETSTNIYQCSIDNNNDNEYESDDFHLDWLAFYELLN